MPTSHLEHTHRRRQSSPYAQHFRALDAPRRADELVALRKLYEDDELSIRQIAARKEASYGFLRARLVEAGVDLAVNSTSYVPPAQQDQR
jgi:hypothetical protein